MKIKTAKFILFIFITVGCLSMTLTPAISAEKISKMTKEALKGMLDSPDLVILDARAGRDWTSSEFKIQGAHRADPGDVAGWTGKYSKEKTVVLYCA
jgi:hypothetical protein